MRGKVYAVFGCSNYEVEKNALYFFGYPRDKKISRREQIQNEDARYEDARPSLVDPGRRTVQPLETGQVSGVSGTTPQAQMPRILRRTPPTKQGSPRVVHDSGQRRKSPELTSAHDENEEKRDELLQEFQSPIPEGTQRTRTETPVVGRRPWRNLFRRQPVVSVEEGGKQPIDKKKWWRKLFQGVWHTGQVSRGMSRQEEVRATLRELVIYLIFLAFLLIAVLGMTSTTMYYFTKVISELFLDTPSSNEDGVTFREMSTLQGWWSFAETVMIDNFFWDFWYRENSPNYQTSDDDKKMLYENKILGLPRLRQLQVRGNSCEVHEDFRRSFSSCYDFYSEDAEFREPFGPGTKTAWVYSTEKELQGTSHWGLIASYGGGGYYQDLPLPDRQAVIDTVKMLKENLWITRGTRAVFLDFTVYNANINLFCIAKMVAEIPPTGGVVPSWQFRVVKLIRYVTAFDFFVMACELMVIVFIIYFTIQEVQEMWAFKLSYFKYKWNWMDLILLIMAYICIFFNIYRNVVVHQTLDSLLENEAQYANFDNLGFWQLQYDHALAVFVFFSWIKIFKFISFNKTMQQFSRTMNRVSGSLALLVNTFLLYGEYKCARDIGGFTIMFIIVFLAFAQLGHLLFGTMVDDFSTFGLAILTLVRAVIGDFEYDAIEKANRFLAPVYFLSYVFFIFFVLLNMFLAIINDTYSEVKSEQFVEGEEFEIVDFLRIGRKNLLNKLRCRRMPKQEKEVLTAEDIRDALRKCNFTDVEIEAFMNKYDLRPGDEIGEDEAMKMLAEIDAQHRPGSVPAMGRPSSVRQTLVTPAEVQGLRARIDRVEKALFTVMQKIDALITKVEKHYLDRKDKK